MTPPVRRRPARRWAWIGSSLAALLAAWLACGWLAVERVTAPQCSSVAPITALAGRPVTAVSTLTADGIEIGGSFVEASDRRVVIVLAGYGGNRTSNQGLAEFYLACGWSVLLPDLRATGASGGDRIGLGWLERLDVRAWVEFATQRGLREVGLHGQSLGAAAVAYHVAESSTDYAFLVLDGCYDDIRNALRNRLPWVPLAQLTLLPVEWFGAAALGVAADALRPAACLGSVSCPVLFVAGDEDGRVHAVLRRPSRGARGGAGVEVTRGRPRRPIVARPAAPAVPRGHFHVQDPRDQRGTSRLCTTLNSDDP